MSLVKRTSTPVKIAANQANGRLSFGPATAEGIERIREANTRHGFYSRCPGEALRVLGEDPEEFARLHESLAETWQPANEFERRLVERLARALLRMERGDRAQEGMAVEQLERLDRRVDRMAREAKARYEAKLAALNALMDAAGKASFFAGWPELRTFGAVFGTEPKGRGEEIMILLHRLLKPPPADGATLADNTAPEPMLGVPVAEGSERYRERERLLAYLREEVDAVKAEQVREGEELLATTSAYFRDAMMAPVEPGAALMLRMEDSSFRQVVRLTNLLMVLKAKAGRNQPSAGREASLQPGWPNGRRQAAQPREAEGVGTIEK